MRNRWLILAGCAVPLAGCFDSAALLPVNAQAQAAGAGQMSYTVGINAGPMRIKLADGETLPGTFAISETQARDNFSATARDARTTLTCRGTMLAGHGKAQCLGTDGAVYDLTL